MGDHRVWPQGSYACERVLVHAASFQDKMWSARVTVIHVRWRVTSLALDVKVNVCTDIRAPSTVRRVPWVCCSEVPHAILCRRHAAQQDCVYSM